MSTKTELEARVEELEVQLGQMLEVAGMMSCLQSGCSRRGMGWT